MFGVVEGRAARERATARARATATGERKKPQLSFYERESIKLLLDLGEKMLVSCE